MAIDFERVTVTLTPHPNADNLALVTVGGGQQVAVNKQHWRDGDEAAYVYPDALVDTEDATFAFLRKKDTDPRHHRVRAIRLRGVKSFGLLVPWRDGLDAVVSHWNPPERPDPCGEVQTSRGKVRLPVQQAFGPDVPKYDLGNGRRFWESVLNRGDPVTVTEKIHGANARFVFHQGRFCVGSRNLWKHRPTPPTVDLLVAAGVDPNEAEEIAAKRVAAGQWHGVADRNPWIEEWCRAHPEVVLFGEVYGADVQGKGFEYDAVDGLFFRAFDVYEGYTRWEHSRFVDELGDNPTAPLVFDGPFDPDLMDELADSPSALGGGLREGVVVGSGQVKLKWVGFRYLSRGDK